MSPGGPVLRVMSFNVLNAHSGHHTGRWDLRKKPVVMAIWAFGPDLVGLQELQSVQAKYLRSQLREYGVISAGRDQGLFAGESVAIFYRKGRFEKVDEGRFWLSKRPDKPGSRDWGAVMPRLVCWGSFRDLARDTDEPIFLFNTHFDALSRWARFRSARTLRQRVGAIAGDAPAVVTGDFNANAGRKLYRTVLGEPGAEGPEFADAYRQVHPVRQRGEGTWHGRGIRSSRRIDWILHTPHLQAIDAGIDRAKRDGRWPSDHFPVTATLRWQEGDAGPQGAKKRPVE